MPARNTQSQPFWLRLGSCPPTVPPVAKPCRNGAVTAARAGSAPVREAPAFQLPGPGRAAPPKVAGSVIPWVSGPVLHTLVRRAIPRPSRSAACPPPVLPTETVPAASRSVGQSVPTPSSSVGGARRTKSPGSVKWTPLVAATWAIGVVFLLASTAPSVAPIGVDAIPLLKGPAGRLGPGPRAALP